METTEVKNKISKKQLEEITRLTKAINEGVVSLGELTMQKAYISASVGNAREKMQAMQLELEEEYGQVTVNLADGSYTKIESEDNKED